jgi:hypothetical protein
MSRCNLQGAISTARTAEKTRRHEPAGFSFKPTLGVLILLKTRKPIAEYPARHLRLQKKWARLPRLSLSGPLGGNQLIFQNLVTNLAEAGIGPNPVIRTVAADFLNFEPITFAQRRRNTGFDLRHETEENGDAGGDKRAKGDG